MGGRNGPIAWNRLAANQNNQNNLTKAITSDKISLLHLIRTVTSNSYLKPQRSWLMKHLPNILTASRLALTIPILLMFLWIDDSPNLQLLVLTLTIAAALTDCLDGYLARKWNCVSDLGKTLDPLADKWLVILYLPLVAKGVIGFLPVAILFLRDLSITYLRGQSGTVIPAKLSGKIKTAISLLLLCCLIASLPVPNSHLAYFQSWRVMLDVAAYVMAFACVWSGWDYAYQIIKNGK